MGQSLAESFGCSLIAELALKEQAFGDFEGMTTVQLSQHNPDAAKALFKLDAEYCPPGGSLSHMHRSELCIFYPIWKKTTSSNNMYCVSRAGHSGLACDSKKWSCG